MEEWKQHRMLLRNQPNHDFGVGKYYKIPNSGFDEEGYFAFIKAVYDKRFYEEDIDSAVGEPSIKMRCDSGAPKLMPMPTSLHETDDETGICKTCGSSESVYPTTNSHHASLNNSKILRIPMHGYKGFICYLELKDQDDEDKEVYENTNVARTLQELFKLMLEWEWVYLNLDQDDICAKLSYEILQEYDLPISIREWLWNEVPDMHVARFLKGDPDARSRGDVSKIPNMSEDFEYWCVHQIVMKEQLWKYGSR